MACVRFRRGRWVIDFYDQDGVRRWHTMPEGSTKRDANIKKGELEKKVQNKNFRAPKSLPLFATVADDWLINKVNIRENTKEGYKGHIEKHLKPSFENMKINQISLAVVEQFRATLLDNGTTVATTRKILTTLSQIMKYATKHHYVDHNPVRDLERLESSGDEEHRDEDLNILQPDQINTLIGAATTHRDKVLFITAALTGMRQGELFGLKWTDIDWINKQIHVKRTYNHGRFYKPKSKYSRRSIDLAPQLVAELRKWKLACPKGDLVFPNEVGNPEHPSNFLSRRFYPALVVADLPQIRFHDLRHTFASLLLDQGENIKYIQRQLGHSSIKVTLDVYGHLMNPVNHEAATKLGNTIFGEMVADR